MKQEILENKIWTFELETIDDDTMVIARSEDGTFAEWIDFDHCRLEPVDHAEVENLTEDEVDAIREKVNSDLEELARETGYIIGTNDEGYDGTLEYAGDDEDLAEKIRGMY